MEILLQVIISSAITGSVIALFGVVYKELHTDSREIKAWQRDKLIKTAEEAYVAMNSINTSKAKEEAYDDIKENISDYLPEELKNISEKIDIDSIPGLKLEPLTVQEQIELIDKIGMSEFIFKVLGSKKLYESFHKCSAAIQDPNISSNCADNYLEPFIEHLKKDLRKPPKLKEGGKIMQLKETLTGQANSGSE